MVYEKNRSGDPDYDDKQPPEFHAGGQVVSAGDGVRIDPVTGPVDAEGAHANLTVGTEDLDNRPSPGNVAKAGSLVQDYSAEDTPTVGEEVDADHGDVAQIKAGQEAVQAANLANSGIPGMEPDVDTSATQPAPAVTNAETPTTPAKAAKATGSSSSK
jgi:hypothetical protein